MLDRVDNVIIRNIHFSDAYDYFPAWDPKDNSQGEWNSDYDNLTLRGATHVWIDHCTFDDGARPDNLEPVHFGRRVQHHDGLLDITQQSNWVTVSWNHFRQHDKTTLVGSSDNQMLDQGKLKVTFHHNLYEEVRERTPRVRYGQVHLYNNLYLAKHGSAYPYGYSIGVGVASQIVSEANVWNTPDDIPSSRLVRLLKGNLFSDSGSLHNGQSARLHEALRASYPDVNVSSDVGWKPSFHLPLDPVANVETLVYTGAGVLGRQR
jgi:pectate lyase